MDKYSTLHEYPISNVIKQVFSCDSSSISHNVGLSVCLSVCRSVCGQRVLLMHSGLVSALLLQLLLCLILLVLQIYFQLQMTSISNIVSQSECQFRVLVVCLCVCNEFHRYIMLLFFSCDSSSISHTVCLVVCLLVCWSVCLSVCPQRVLQQCYTVGSVYVLLILLLLRLLDHSVVIFCIFSCDSSSMGHNVSLSVRNKFYESFMLLLVYDCCYCCCI